MDQGKEDKAYTQFVSHQLKSPINAIHSLLKTVTEGFTGEIPAQTKYTIEKAIARTTEASAIVTDILDFERYSKEEGLELSETDIISLLDDLIKTYSLTASEKDLSLLSDVPFSEKIFLKGDAEALTHALKNLIENAIKYTPQFGKITLGFETDKSTRIIRISIADTGEGIPEDEMQQLFTPFFRSRKHKKSKPGTGLGLAIVKKIIEAHGGSIDVESKEDEGSQFSITLPFVRKDVSGEERKPRKRVVIIGGVTSGPKAAARLRRLDEDIEITIIEEREFLSYTGCQLPDYISDRMASSSSIISTPGNRVRNARFFQQFKRITTLTNTRALAIDRKQQHVEIEDLRQGTKKKLSYDILVLATGARPYFPEIPGINSEKVYTVYSLEGAKVLKQRILRQPAQECFIIGGGLIGATLAQSLLEMGVRITIVEKEPSILNSYFDRDMAHKLENLFSRKGIRIITGVEIQEIGETDNRLEIKTSRESYHADFILCSAGVRPDVSLAEASGLDISPAGGIKIDDQFRTSDKHIYAIGDCADSPHLLTKEHEFWPLGSVSTKMGRMVADIIGGKDLHFSGSLGSTMFKCFDLSVARTGLTKKRAQELGYKVETVVVTGTDKPKHRPDSSYIFFKICCDVETRRVLGAQALGSGDVAGRISLLASCISQSMTVKEIFSLDLGYAPEFTLPIDISQTACAVLENKCDGLLHTISCEELSDVPEDAVFITVDPSPEKGLYLIPGSMEIPIEQLRNEDLGLEKSRPIVLYCRTSAFAYKGYRYLQSQGYSSVKVLEGGYLFWEK